MRGSPENEQSWEVLMVRCGQMACNFLFAGFSCLCDLFGLLKHWDLRAADHVLGDRFCEDGIRFWFHSDHFIVCFD